MPAAPKFNCESNLPEASRLDSENVAAKDTIRSELVNFGSIEDFAVTGRKPRSPVIRYCRITLPITTMSKNSMYAINAILILP